MSERTYRTRDEAGTVNGGVSFWFRQIGLPEPGPSLPGDLSVDVCIVGGGLTGLWTAYHLATAQPDLRIVVLEKEFAGYGASGRNGGWLSAELAGNLERYAAHRRPRRRAPARTGDGAERRRRHRRVPVGGHRRRRRQGRRPATWPAPSRSSRGWTQLLAHHRSWGIGERPRAPR